MNMMRVTEILQTVTGSCDYGQVSDFPGATEDEQRTAFWQHVIAGKASDTGFGHLVESILANGWAGDSAIGWYFDSISEGHHRLVAAILLGLDEVPVTPSGRCANVTPLPGQHYFSAHYYDKDPYPVEVDFRMVAGMDY